MKNGENEVIFTKSLLYLLSLLELFRPTFKAKYLASVCILVFCIMTCLCFYYCFIIKTMHFSSSAPAYFDPLFIKFQNFF